jgi:hypothetical protein
MVIQCVETNQRAHWVLIFSMFALIAVPGDADNQNPVQEEQAPAAEEEREQRRATA